jgi:hypothetical protein
MHVRCDKCIQNLVGKSDIDLDGRIILTWISGK